MQSYSFIVERLCLSASSSKQHAMRWLHRHINNLITHFWVGITKSLVNNRINIFHLKNRSKDYLYGKVLYCSDNIAENYHLTFQLSQGLQSLSAYFNHHLVLLAPKLYLVRSYHSSKVFRHRSQLFLGSGGDQKTELKGKEIFDLHPSVDTQIQMNANFAVCRCKLATVKG